MVPQIVQQQMPHLAAGMLQAAQAQAAAATAAQQAASKPKASRVYDDVRQGSVCWFHASEAANPAG
jgi:hypothetical protein